MNEGSLLRRTLLHMAALVVVSASFVAVVSVVLVTTTKALLPSHDSVEAAADTAKPEDREGSSAENSADKKSDAPSGARAQHEKS